MNNQQSPTGGLDRLPYNLADKVTFFLFDPINKANQRGFKSNNLWSLLSATPLPALLTVNRQFKSKLNKALSVVDLALRSARLTKNQHRQLVSIQANNPHK